MAPFAFARGPESCLNAASDRSTGNDLRQLGWLLAWAVVFCDIGTSVYFVPGILYGEVGNLAPAFVALTTIGFVLLAMKYVEVSWRNPEGGGVVTVATKAFNPMMGAIGGMLILVDYFLTAAISAVSAFQYIGSVLPFLAAHVEIAAAAGLVLLALINMIGIKESATLALYMAGASFAVNLVVLAVVASQLTPDQWAYAWSQAHAIRGVSTTSALVGFAGAWLAFSGLESISQLSPAMKNPIRSTASKAMLLVILTMALTSPTLTTVAIAGLSEATKSVSKEYFISELGRVYGGVWLAWSVVVSASALLLFAANTALIGGYHVFVALARAEYMPSVLAKRNRLFGTPHIGIIVFTVVTLLVVHGTGGKLELLGHMYSFGLLGAFTFTSAGLDIIRWREGQRGLNFWVGVFTTLMVATAWGVNIVHKSQATLFGGGVVALGVVIAIGIRKDWVIRALNQLPWVATEAQRQRERAEDIWERRSREIVSLETAIEAAQIEPSRTLIALRDRNPRLIAEAILRAKGNGDTSIFVLAVTEWPGLFSGEQLQPEPELLEAIDDSAERIRAAGLTPIPIWRLSHNAAISIAEAARMLRVNSVMVGVSQRSQLVHMLRGSVLKGLHRLLPGDEILIHTVG
jgi:amino acid transporter